MTGVNKQVTVNFVILKLLGHQCAWAEINDEVPYDEEAAKEAAMQWALQWAMQWAIVANAGKKAAKLVANKYEALADCSAVHIIEGRGAAVVSDEYDAFFRQAIGRDPVDVVCLVRTACILRTLLVEGGPNQHAFTCELCPLLVLSVQFSSRRRP